MLGGIRGRRRRGRQKIRWLDGITDLKHMSDFKEAKSKHREGVSSRE